MQTPPDTSAAVLQKLEPRLRAIPAERLSAPRPDAKLVALAALGVADRLAAPGVRERFERLPREELKLSDLDELRPAAWALWHARAELDAALGAAQPLPQDLVDRGLALKERMLRVLGYYFAEELKKPLQQMQRRKGNGELPADLSRLAALYRERRDTLEGDKAHYRKTDADDADGVAADAARLEEAWRAQAGARAGEQVSRAFALLVEIYDEVRAAGLYLFRKDPECAALFPPLSAPPARRGRPPKSVASEAAPGEPPPAPALDPGAPFTQDA